MKFKDITKTQSYNIEAYGCKKLRKNYHNSHTSIINYLVNPLSKNLKFKIDREKEKESYLRRWGD